MTRWLIVGPENSPSAYEIALLYRSRQRMRHLPLLFSRDQMSHKCPREVYHGQSIAFNLTSSQLQIKVLAVHRRLFDSSRAKCLDRSAAKKRMTPQKLVDRLVTFFPDFQAYWDDPGNCFRNDDGSFTLHGVFAEFTNFFRERHGSLPADRMAALGRFVSDCMMSTDKDLDNAAATGFVENIAGEDCDRPLAPHLTGEARKYWKSWGGRDEINERA
jgi:hypothetical protein